LVRFSSVEDDCLGEELDVIWELEPGAVAHARSTLPEPKGFDQPQVLDAFLDAVRWGLFLRLTIRPFNPPSAAVSKLTTTHWTRSSVR
jgi:hypothetical protein